MVIMPFVHPRAGERG